MIDLNRILRHLLTTHGRVRRAFPPQALDAIELEIGNSEKRYAGQIRFAVEYALSGSPLYRGQTSRARAVEVFSQLRVWDTDHRNGVLIYVLMADRSVEIVADRNARIKTSAGDWEKICRDMEIAFRSGRYEAGVISASRAVTELLAPHFPLNRSANNALPDNVII